MLIALVRSFGRKCLLNFMDSTSNRQAFVKPFFARLQFFAIHTGECSGMCLAVANAQSFGYSVITFDLECILDGCLILAVRFLCIVLLLVWRLFDLCETVGGHIATCGNTPTKPAAYCHVCQSRFCNPWNHWNHNPQTSSKIEWILKRKRLLQCSFV